LFITNEKSSNMDKMMILDLELGGEKIQRVEREKEEHFSWENRSRVHLSMYLNR